MAYNTKPIVTDVDGNPISQYYNPDTDSYEPVEGANGANKVLVENNDLSLIPILEKLSQLTGTVIDEETRKSNELERIDNENARQFNEDIRNTNEIERVANENIRIENENTRINNENIRKANEQNRIDLYNDLMEKVSTGYFNGKNLEFHWNGTSLGVRVEGDSEYIYVDLKGETGNIENLTMQHVINALGYTPINEDDLAAHKAENVTDAHLPAKNLSLYRHELYPEQQPTLVLTYDDGYLEDFTNILPVHQAHGVPGVSYVSSGAMGQIEDRVLGTRQFMTLDQLKILEANGWEIGCHTKTHKPLGGRKPLLPITVNDTKIYIAQSYEYFYRLTNTVELQIKEGEVEETIIAVDYGEDATGSYIELQQPIQNSYTTEATIRLSWAEYERELLGNLFTLRQLGLDVRNHAYPFGKNDSIARILAAKYYTSASGTKRGIHQGLAAIEQEPLRTFEMWRVQIDGKDNQFIENQLDEVVQKKGLLMFFGHPNKDADLPDRVDYAITQAKARGIKIVTHREALEMFGNIIEVGDWIGAEENRYNRRPGYFVVTKRGAIYCPWLELGGAFNNQAITTLSNALIIRGQNVAFQNDQMPIFHMIKGRKDIAMNYLTRGNGLVVTTPDGQKKFRIRVDNNGNVVTDDVTSEYPTAVFQTTWDGD